MRSRLWARSLAALAAALLCGSLTAAVAGCGGADDDSSDSSRRSSSKDRDRDGIPDRDDECPREKENKGGWDDDSDGCPDTIEDLIELARSDVGGFWEGFFAGGRQRYKPPAEFVGYTTEIETACGAAELENAFYCQFDHSIYYDQGFLEDELDENGDFGPIFIIAHEWGHLVQSNLLLLEGDNYSIDIELQADCLAGVYTADAEEREILEEGDFEEAIISLFRVGDSLDTPWYDPRAHGTAGQRIDAFQMGYQRGFDACLAARRR